MPQQRLLWDDRPRTPGQQQLQSGLEPEGSVVTDEPSRAAEERLLNHIRGMTSTDLSKLGAAALGRLELYLNAFGVMGYEQWRRADRQVGFAVGTAAEPAATADADAEAIAIDPSPAATESNVTADALGKGRGKAKLGRQHHRAAGRKA